MDMKIHITRVPLTPRSSKTIPKYDIEKKKGFPQALGPQTFVMRMQRLQLLAPGVTLLETHMKNTRRGTGQ